jgi:L-threonylcarbamoyladenylate synthase
VLDSGPTAGGIESTVIDLGGAAPRLLRPGPLDLATLEACLAAPIEHGPLCGPARSPGQRARHYAPHAPALRVGSLAELEALSPGPSDAVLVVGHPALAVPGPAHAIALPDPELAARSLYATLRACDARGVARILVIMPPAAPAWQAVRDRLERATVPA